jgi:hypothetical protein
MFATRHLKSMLEGTRVRSVLRLAALASLLIAAAPLVAQQKADEHMVDAASLLYQRSAFAHGYLHGYEQGFHLADLDIQMGHMLPGVRIRRQSHEEDPHYRPGYGDKRLFVTGFKLGMRAGYTDSLGGVPFRAISEMRNAADGLAAAEPTSAHFDRGFYEGFLNGNVQGAKGAKDPHAVDLAGISNTCRQQHAADKPEHGPPYCDGYTRGFRLGYNDGHAEQLASQKAIETAQNSKGH